MATGMAHRPIAGCRFVASKPAGRRLGQAVRAASTSAPSTQQGRKATASQPPYNVVITGSTKGVGRALAEEFLRQGDCVLVSSRSDERVAEAVQQLSAQFGAGKVKGIACNVGRADEVRALADYAKAQLGHIDVWINNAGTNAYKYGPLTDSSDEDLQEIVQTNVLGIMLCCREAVRVMKDQDRPGHVFNMDGAGADGSPTPRFAAYGATKRSLAQLGKSLNAELSQASIRNVGIHNLSPGMVTTELLMSGANTPVAKFFINCLAETPDEVATTIVPKIRRVPQDNINPLTGTINPAYIQYLTKPKAYGQILSRLVSGNRKDRFVKE